MKNKKITLWAIIILLIIFIPMAAFSTIMHYKNANQPEENPNHQLRYEGKLYFYNNNELLGTYTCENYNEYCNYAISTVKNDYSLDERNVESNTKLPIVNNRFVFIMDAKTEELADAEILLYDLSFGKVIGEYKEVKNYGIGIENDYYIIKNQKDLWGVVSLENGIALKLPFEYDYIGLSNKVDSETEKVSSDMFAVLKEDSWQLIDINGATFVDELTSEIFAYNTEYVVLNNGNSMQLIDYKENIILNGYKYINFYNKYLQIIDTFNQFYLYDLNKKERISNVYAVTSIEDIELNIENNEIQIIKDDNIEETIAIE